MDLATYKTFLVLCETKNFTMTGKRLHIVQSTVSNRIKDLENHYDRKLFTRVNKTVELTIAGRQLIPYIKRLVDMEKEAYDQMQLIKIDKLINLGSYQLAYHCYIKEHIIKNYSKHQYVIKIEHSWNLYEYLDDHLIDIAYTSYYDRRDKYHLIKQIEEPILHVKAPNYKGDQIIYAPISNDFIEWYDLHYASFIKVMSIDQSVETIDYILKGVGTGFLPQSVASKYIDDESLEKISSPLEPYIHTTFVVCRSKDVDKYDKYILEM